MPAVFRWLQKEGGIFSSEMVRTFNCGIGMVCVVDKESVEAVERVLKETDPELDCYRIGALEPRGEKRLDCIIDGSVG